MGSQKRDISIQDSRKRNHRQTGAGRPEREMTGPKISGQARQREVSGGQARLGRLRELGLRWPLSSDGFL